MDEHTKFEQLTERAAKDLGEHFEGVLILVTYRDENNKAREISRGSGNYYTRLGLAHNFITGDNAEVNAAASMS